MHHWCHSVRYDPSMMGSKSPLFQGTTTEDVMRRIMAYTLGAIYLGGFPEPWMRKLSEKLATDDGPIFPVSRFQRVVEQNEQASTVGLEGTAFSPEGRIWGVTFLFLVHSLRALDSMEMRLHYGRDYTKNMKRPESYWLTLDQTKHLAMIRLAEATTQYS